MKILSLTLQVALTNDPEKSSMHLYLVFPHRPRRLDMERSIHRLDDLSSVLASLEYLVSCSDSIDAELAESL